MHITRLCMYHSKRFLSPNGPGDLRLSMSQVNILEDTGIVSPGAGSQHEDSAVHLHADRIATHRVPWQHRPRARCPSCHHWIGWPTCVAVSGVHHETQNCMHPPRTRTQRLCVNSSTSLNRHINDAHADEHISSTSVDPCRDVHM